MSRDPSDNKPSIPAWLREQPLPPRPVSDERETSAGGTPPGQPEHSTAADTASEELPDWLQTEPLDATPAGNETLPDWLRESAAPNAPAGNEALPDWLRESAATNTPNSKEPVSDWSSEPEATADSATSPEQDAEDMPDWLRGLAEDPVPAAPDIATPAASSESVPDWLLAMAEETPDIAPATAPDWLHEAQPPPSETPNEQSAGATAMQSLGDSSSEPAGLEQPSGNQDIHDWLSDISVDRVQAAMGAEDALPEAVPFSLEGLGPATERVPDSPSGPPAWLGDDTPETSSWFDSPTPTPAAPAPSELGDDDAPNWLQNIAQESPAEDRGQAESTFQPIDELPTWLQPSANEPNDQVGEGHTVEQATAPSEDIPTWLRETPSRAAEEDVPAWLREPSADASSDQSTAPDWLGAAEPTTEPPASAAQSADDESLPTWLRDEQAEPPLPAAPIASAAPDDQELPPWLRDDSGAPLATAGQPGEQALPPWLKGATANEPAVPILPQSTPLPSREPVPADDWFDQAVSGAEVREEPAESEFFGGTDLPAWLRPQEQPASAANAADSRALDWLTRIGSAEDEVAVPVIATARFSPPLSPIKTEEQTRAIALLAQLAETPTSARPQVAAEPIPSLWQRAGAEWLLYVLLLLALLAGPFLPGLTAPLQVPPVDPNAQSMFNQISTLDANDVVLIGYDWDARRVAELRPLETAVIDQLVAQKVKLVLMSTDPQGSLLLYDLREKLNGAGYQPRGEDYILLGYQPGGELALRAMAQNFGQLLTSDFQNEDVSASQLALGTSTGTNTQLDSLSNFSMIMLLADDQADVQSWMEQVQRAVPDVPFATLLTAEAAPAAEPYFALPNVYHLSGTTGALAYTAQRGGDTTLVAAESGQLRLGMATFVVLLLLGAAVVAIANAMRRRNT